MGYNKKALSKIKADLNSAKGPSKPRDIIYDPRGQWEHPGKPTRIPGGNITMQGVPYPVMAYPNIGQPQMMYPNQDYNFPGADYVDEYPQMRRGGSKKFTRDITATNVLFTKNPYLKKRKKRKNRVYDPTAPYYQYGGAKLIYSPYSVNEFSALTANPIYTPSQSMALVVPHMFSSKKTGVPRIPLQFTLGRQYDTSAEKLTNPAYNIYKPMPYTTDYSDVAEAYGKDVDEITQADRNKYAAEETLGKLTPKYKPGKPIDANVRLNIQGVGQDKNKNVKGNLAFNVGYNPQSGFYAGSEGGVYGILGNVDPSRYFKQGVTKRGDIVLTPSLTVSTAIRQKQGYPISEEKINEYRDLLQQDIAQGTQNAVDYYNKNLNSDIKNMVAAARPEIKAEYRPFKKLPVNLEGVLGANIDFMGKEADARMGSLKPTISPYGKISAVIPLKEAQRDISRIIDPRPVKETKVPKTPPKPKKEKIETEENPCPPGYTRDKPGEECYRERAHHTRWLKEGGKLGPIPLNSGRKVLRDWTYGKTIGMLQEDDGGYIETELTPEEIQAYRDGGYIVEEIDRFRKGGSKRKKTPLDYKAPEKFYTSAEEAFPLPKTSKIESLVKPIDLLKMTPEELERYNQDEIIRENKIRKETKFNADKIAQPQYFNEGIQWIKDWHNSPMYNQMVLNSFKGDKEKADYLTKLRKENIESIPALKVREEEENETAAGFKPAGRSHDDTGLIEIFPGGYNYGPSIYVHEGLHSSDRPRGLYKHDDPTYQTKKSPDYFYNKGTDLGESWYIDEKGSVVDYPDWMIYSDPRFPKEDVVWHDRVMPPSDQMSITTKRGSNWKDNEAYKIAMEKGLYNPRGEDYWKNIMINDWETDPNDPTFNQQLNEVLNYEKELLQEDLKNAPKKWKQFAHGYVSTPTEVRARLGEIRFHAQKEGIYDPFTEKVTPEIFQNYINKKREDNNWQPMKSLNELRDDFQDEEILWMLNNISKTNNDSDSEIPRAQKGGSIEAELTPEEIEWYKSQGYEVEELD